MRESDQMGGRDKMQAASFAVSDFMARFWLEAENTEAGRSDLYFVEDGTFRIEGMVDARGRDQIRQVSAFRRGLGQRNSRHIMSNYVVDLPDEADGCLYGRAVMTHFGGSGPTPLPLEGPLGIYDVKITLSEQPDGSLLLKSLFMQPIFVGKDHPNRTKPLDLSE